MRLRIALSHNQPSAQSPEGLDHGHFQSGKKLEADHNTAFQNERRFEV
jgi:hypothetical protein